MFLLFFSWIFMFYYYSIAINLATVYRIHGSQQMTKHFFCGRYRSLLKNKHSNNSPLPQIEQNATILFHESGWVAMQHIHISQFGRSYAVVCLFVHISPLQSTHTLTHSHTHISNGRNPFREAEISKIMSRDGENVGKLYNSFDDTAI